ncbi:MAG: HAD family hydrolase [Cyanobacteria bacterium J083]|nr:MAG: HAD family hydrolase [Cyanobacteria bacterium J083]
MSKQRITHLIFDMDGLLLDTESLHKQVNETIAQRYGKIFDNSVRVQMIGRPTFDSAQVIVKHLALPISPAAYLEQRNELLYQLYPQAQPLPGAKELTCHFAQHQIPQAIATSSSCSHFEKKMKQYDKWLELFDCLVLGDDPAIKQGKPAPDIFLLAAARLKADPNNCLVFEDSVAGMKAAIAAGMSVVVVPDADFDRNLFTQADLVLNSLEEFNPGDWGLPQF